MLGDENKNGFFAVDESLFGHIEGKQLWLLGIINNDFRIEPTYKRNIEDLKKFISKQVAKGNNICTDGWQEYDYLDDPQSGYHRYRHNHGGGDFGFGIQSTSHIESLWAHLKDKIKNTYHVIPGKNILKFIKEAEYKYKLRKLSPEDKIKELIESYSFLLFIGELNLGNNDESDNSSESE